MTTHTEPTVVENDHTRKSRVLMRQLMVLRDAVTDPEVRAELQEEMNCVGMSWQFRQMFDEEEESPPQTKPQANATALQS